MVSTPSRAAERVPAASDTGSVAAGKRLHFVDNLRVALIILVIAHHAGQAYGPTGGAWPLMETARSALLGPFFTVNRSFFMSLFFMISGYFTVVAFDTGGTQRFVKSRLARLGLPVLAWALLVAIPFQVFVSKAAAWPVDVAHMWFVQHLLIFSLCYALWRVVTQGRTRSDQGVLDPPGVLPILGLALLIAVVSLVVRNWYPIDRWVLIFGFIKVMWADVPRDLAFFIVGLLAARHDWLRRFPTRAGMIWLGVGLALALFWYAFDLGLTGTLVPYTGIAFDLMRVVWEGVLVCALCIGLTVLFREKVNMGGPRAKALGQSTYAVYIFHLFFVLLCQFAVLNLPLPPLVKFALVTLAATPLTFLFSNWVRKPLRL
jgi:fucose 4-O-acetylase-like acetyltransferase